MPRYIKVDDIPEILRELQTYGSGKTPYQLNEWQGRRCHITNKPEENAAVLSYRWRIRGRNENITDYKRWVSDCGSEGYSVFELRDGSRPVDWSLADGNAIQIETAAWLLWLYTNKVADYAWIDQMCVPQDVKLEEKMGYIRDSPSIYKTGKVYVVLAPVVDYNSGRIMNSNDAHAIVKQYQGEMKFSNGYGFLSRSAVKALLVNHSYMRRVWTIQEAVAGKDMTVWPLKGRGDVASYQSIYIVDWPEFNAWNGHPALGPLYLKFDDAALNGYYEGDYTKLIEVLRQHPSDGIAYLAMISKDLMWITMDRNGLVNDIKKAESAAKRAWMVLNNHQIQSARAFCPEDKVLALVPLVDYNGWRDATQGVPAHSMPQASVSWAYGLMEREMATWKWSVRVYNSPDCKARGLELLQPRRNLGDKSSMYGASPDWEVEIPTEGGSFVLRGPSSPANSHVASFVKSTPGSNDPLQLRVEAALLTPHPGQAKYWGEGPWKSIRDALQTDEVFRLSVQWGLEPWRNPVLGLDAERCAVVVVSGGGLKQPAMIIVGLRRGGGEPYTGQVMEVVEVSSGLLSSLLNALRRIAHGSLEESLTIVSDGVDSV